MLFSNYTHVKQDACFKFLKVCVYFSFQIAREGQDRPGIWLDSLIHSNEWLAGATLMGIADYVNRITLDLSYLQFTKNIRTC